MLPLTCQLNPRNFLWLTSNLRSISALNGKPYKKFDARKNDHVQLEHMRIKNVQLYNSNKEKDKEIAELKNQNFKERFKQAPFEFLTPF